MSTVDLTANPPNSEEAEKVVIGSMIIASPLIDDILQIAKPEDFYQPKHTVIVENLKWLSDNNHPIELPSLISRLENVGELQKIGGREYIANLYTSASPPNAMYYAEIIAEKSSKRKLINLHIKGIRDAQEGSGVEFGSLVQNTYSGLDEIHEEKTTSELLRVGETLDETFDEIEQLGKSQNGVTGIPTGFYELDRLTYGFHPGQMIVVAGRPGMGKSTLGLDFVRNASIKHGQPSAFFSLEMSRAEITMRLLSAECGVELNKIRSGKLDDQGWEKLAHKQQTIQDAPLFTDDTPSNTLASIRQKCRRIKQRYGLSLVVIDYMQLMNSDGRVENRQQEISTISRGIKLLAKELYVPVIAMSQLNRQSESRTDNKPKLSDLRESGSIEQDADAVYLIYREDQYDPDTPRAGEADVIIAKQRSAATGVATLGWQGAFSRFVDVSFQTD